MNFRKYFNAQEVFDYDQLDYEDKKYRALPSERQLGNREYNRDLHERERSTKTYLRSITRASYISVGV